MAHIHYDQEFDKVVFTVEPREAVHIMFALRTKETQETAKRIERVLNDYNLGYSEGDDLTDEDIARLTATPIERRPTTSNDPRL